MSSDLLRLITEHIGVNISPDLHVLNTPENVEIIRSYRAAYSRSLLHVAGCTITDPKEHYDALLELINILGINITDEYGWTPLMDTLLHYSQEKQQNWIRFLIKHGADVNIRSTKEYNGYKSFIFPAGVTILDIAEHTGMTHILPLLLSIPDAPDPPRVA